MEAVVSAAFGGDVPDAGGGGVSVFGFDASGRGSARDVRVLCGALGATKGTRLRDRAGVLLRPRAFPRNAGEPSGTVDDFVAE